MLLAETIEQLLVCRRRVVLVVVLALFELGLDLNARKESSVNVTDWPRLVLLRVNVMRSVMNLVKAGVLYGRLGLTENIDILTVDNGFLHVVSTLFSLRK